jgi:transposase
MSEAITELGRRLVIGHKRDGRSIFDPQAKRELVDACLQSGVSLAKVARECGINANQLATWVRERRRSDMRVAKGGDAVEVPPMFVPVRLEAAAPRPEFALSLQARLPNGVVIDLREVDMAHADKLLQALGRLRCSASTTA